MKPVIQEDMYKADSQLSQSKSIERATYPTITKTEHLDALSYLRFFAALVVIVEHLSAMFGFYSTTWLHQVALWQAVSFFFVMSGFILTYVYPQLQTTEERNRFLFTRIARIWPTHLLTFALILVLLPSLFRTPHFLLAAPINLAMIQSWLLIPGFVFTFNAPTWSISTEFFYYFCFPAMLALLNTSWKKLLVIASLLTVSSLGFCCLEYWPNVPDFGIGFPKYINASPFCRITEFVLGMVLCLAYRRYGSSLPLTKMQATVLECLAVTAIVIPATSPLFVQGHVTGPLSVLRAWFLCCAGAPFYGALIFVMACQKGYLSKMLSFKPLSFVGDLAFALYMFHGPVFVFFRAHRQSFFEWPFALLMCLVLAITFLISHLNYVTFETPSRRAMINLFDKLTGRHLAPGSQPYHFSGATGGNSRREKFMISAECLILLTLVVVAGWQVCSDEFAYRFVDDATAYKFEKHHKAVVKDLNIGNRFRLRALSEKWSNDGLQLTLVWQSLAAQRLDGTIALHVIDKDGHLISARDFVQDEDNCKVKTGQVWADRVSIDRNILANATSIGVGIYTSPGAKLMPIDRGERDCNQGRLIVPIEGKKPIN
jgi:peptidoglycan/LPS O-acetylase OafA/YrhL